jgi:uncharacterized protein YbjT (DUF2867 family)
MAVEGPILVTGASGQQGGALARELLARGHTVKAMTRKPDSDAAKALAKQGAKIVEGDLDDEASLDRAIAGAWGVFAVQNTWEAGVEKEEEQGKRFARVAKKHGVPHFVYSSVGSAHRKTGIPHFDNKWRVEEVVRNLGFPSFVIIRPAFFMENLTSPWFKPAIDQGNLAFGMKPTTSLQMIAVKDVGKYLCWAFEKGHELNGRAVDIAGDAKTGPEMAEIISKAAGKKVGFFRVPIAEVRKFSDDFAAMLEWFDAVGYDADIEAHSKESGIKPTTFAEWASSVSWK